MTVTIKKPILISIIFIVLLFFLYYFLEQHQERINFQKMEEEENKRVLTLCEDRYGGFCEKPVSFTYECAGSYNNCKKILSVIQKDPRLKFSQNPSRSPVKVVVKLKSDYQKDDSFNYMDISFSSSEIEIFNKRNGIGFLDLNYIPEASYRDLIIRTLFTMREK